MAKTAPLRHRFNVTALFGGIGGLEYGLASAGHRASAFCEIDPEAATVLQQRFPDAALVRDIRQTEEVRAAVGAGSQLLTAGFPCTDLSQAGRVQGFSGGRSSLVRDALKLVACRPFGHILLENVPNWRSLHRGAYLREVVEALERLGYRWAYRTIDALAFGLPQRRLRIFLYATLEGDPRDVLFHGDVTPPDRTYDLTERAHGFYWTEGSRGLGWGEDCTPTLKGGSSVGVPSAPAVILPDMRSVAAQTSSGDFRIVTPDIRDAERLQGLPPDWTAGSDVTVDGGPYRARRRWLLVGNAVNARVAGWVGERLAQPSPWNGALGRPLAPDDTWPSAAWSDGVRRYAIELGTWPVQAPQEPLADFLTYAGAPLSARATGGFLKRFLKSTLRRPPGFVATLEAHVSRIDPGPREKPRRAA